MDFKAFSENEREIFLRFIRLNNLFASFAEELQTYEARDILAIIQTYFRAKYEPSVLETGVNKGLVKFIELESFLKKELNTVVLPPTQKENSQILAKAFEKLRKLFSKGKKDA